MIVNRPASPDAFPLAEFAVCGFARGADAWARTGGVIQDQYRAMARAAMSRVLEAAAAILTGPTTESRLR